MIIIINHHGRQNVSTQTSEHGIFIIVIVIINHKDNNNDKNGYGYGDDDLERY